MEKKLAKKLLVSAFLMSWLVTPARAINVGSWSELKNAANGSDLALGVTSNLTVDSVLSQYKDGVNINGNGHTINGNGFQIINNDALSGGESITLSDVIIQNALGMSQQGGAINNGSGKTLNIGDNVKFIHNTAGTVYGGSAIHNRNGSVAIGDNVTFEENYSAFTGADWTSGNTGAISNWQGGDLTIGDNVVFKNNGYTNASKDTIGAFVGGAIYNDASGTQLSIGDGAEFEGNASLGGGGAIFNQGAKVEIGDNSIFKNNITNGEGGAIYSQWVDTVLTVGDNAKFTGNKADANGGAVVNYDGTATIGEKALFENNSAGTQGGAIYNAVYANPDATKVIVTVGKDSSFKGNTANEGGAIYNDTNANVNIGANTSFTGNQASSQGGAIYNKGDLVLDTSNTADAGNIVFDQNTAVSGGGDIYQDGGKTTIQGNENSVIFNGSIAGTGSIEKNGLNTVEFNGDNSDYTGSYTQEDGKTVVGGTFFAGNGSNLEIKDGEFEILDTGSLAGDVNLSGAVDLKINQVIDTVNTDWTTGQIYLAEGSGHLNVAGQANLETAGEGNNLNITSIGGAGNSVGDLSLKSGAGLSESLDINGTAALGLGTNVSTVAGNTIALNDSSKLLLGTQADEIDGQSVLNVNADIVGGNANTEVVKADATAVNLTGDNGGYVGKYTQTQGMVNVAKDSTFFGGESTVNGGVLAFQDGSKLVDGTEVKVGFDGDEYGTAVIYGQTSNVDLNTGLVEFEGTTGKINITGAGLTLANGYIYEGDTTLHDTAQGVGDLGFANGAGIDGSVVMEANTNLTYWDDAFIKDNTTLTMGENTVLTFRNDNAMDYNPEIISDDATLTSLLHKTGTGSLNIIKDVNGFDGSVNVDAGALNFKGNAFISNDVTVGEKASMNVAGYAAVEGEVKADKGSITFNKDAQFDKNVSVNDGKISFMGDTVIGNVDISTVRGRALRAVNGNFSANNSEILMAGATAIEGDMSANNSNSRILGNTKIGGNLDFSGTLNTQSGVLNTITASKVTLNGNTSLSIDADGRSYDSDKIVTTDLKTNDSIINLTDIKFNEYAPRDRDFQLKVFRADNIDGALNVIVPDGKMIDTPIGRYAITAGAGGVLNGSLQSFNPQVFRGQVATVASYANQLVTNNLLFDHINIVSQQLIADTGMANKYAAIDPQFAPYQYSKKDGGLWYKAYGNFETISMTQGLNVHNNAYGSLIGADFPLITLDNGWKLLPTAYIGYNGAHQTFNGVGMYQNGGQVGAMGTLYKGDFFTSLLAYGGGYYNSMNVAGYNDSTGNWFAGAASKTAYNIHLPADFIFQPTFMMAYNIFGQQNYHSNYGILGMNSGYLNGINIAPGMNFIWNKETFSLYATAQLVFNIMGDVSGQAGNISLPSVSYRHPAYFEYGLGFTKKIKERLNSYGQFTIRNGTRTGIGFQGGLQWKL